jgi:hypothetical protein
VTPEMAAKLYTLKDKSIFSPQVGFCLGQWCKTHHEQLRQGKLSPEHKKLIESAAGEGWQWRQDWGTQFENGIHTLECFCREHDNPNPLSRWIVTPEMAAKLYTLKDKSIFSPQVGFCLGNWCKVRREQLRKGKLSPEHKKSIESAAGGGWQWDVASVGRGREHLFYSMLFMSIALFYFMSIALFYSMTV